VYKITGPSISQQILN